MSTTESQFSADVVAAFESMGAKVLVVHGHAYQRSGWPDLQVYHPTWTGHIELKVGSNKCSTLQQLTIRDLLRLETQAYVLRLCVDGSLAAEDCGCAVLATLSAERWAFKHGNARGVSLFELSCAAMEAMS